MVTQKTVQHDAFAQIDAVIRMQRAKIIAGFRCRDPLQDAICLFDKSYLQPQLGGDGRSFQADISTANDQHPCTRDKSRSHGIDIRQIPDHENAVQRAANVRRQPPWHRPGGQDQIVKVQCLVTQRNRFGRRVYRSDPRVQPQVHPVEIDHPCEIAQGLVKLFLAGNALGKIELAADLLTRVEQGDRVAALGGADPTCPRRSAAASGLFDAHCIVTCMRTSSVLRPRVCVCSPVKANISKKITTRPVPAVISAQ